MIKACLSGIHPRSERLIGLRSALRWRRKVEGRKVSPSMVERQLEADARSLVRLQRAVGLSPLIDGFLGWNSIIEPFAACLRGVEVPETNLRRWFNTNTFYHKPIVRGELEAAPRLPPGLLRLRALRGPWKAVLPAPYTFARLSEDAYYGNWERLMFAVAEAERGVAKRLERLGCRQIQLDDPALIYRYPRAPPSRDEVAQAKEAVRVVVKPLQAETCYSLYFEDASPVMVDLLNFPATLIGVDFTETHLASLKQLDVTKPLACGFVDARNSLLETPGEIVSFARRVTAELYPNDGVDVYVCPNTGLRYLPRRIADRKALNLGLAARRLRAR